jgi:hypothetical protein
MAREAFIEKKFHKSTLAVIEQADVIIDQYSARGFALTLRQLYYQFVARGLLGENTQRAYKRVGAIVNDARQAGLIDWDAIEDRTRSLRSFNAWSDPGEFLTSVADSRREDPLAVLCLPRQQLAERAIFRRQAFAEHNAEGFTPIVLHLGDHDPNGIDMTGDNYDRLSHLRSFCPPSKMAKAYRRWPNYGGRLLRDSANDDATPTNGERNDRSHTLLRGQEGGWTQNRSSDR